MIVGDQIKLLESRLTAVETSFNQVLAENVELKQTLANIQAELTQLKSYCETRQIGSSTLLDQQEINSNIVIRGVEVNDNTSTAELTNVYEGIRTHLGISDISELAPVSVSLIPSHSSKPNSSLRPIKVALQSTSAKIKFLQVRRTKKDIVQSDIGIASNSKRPVLITEQLTRSNQELLYQARSLREHGNFKFVWSKNGEVFGRHKPNSRVIKIVDKAHVNHLREQLGLPPLSNYGRLLTAESDQPSANNS